MPARETADLSDRELRERRLRDPEVEGIVKEIQREFARPDRSPGEVVTAEELPDFLREHG